MPLATEVKSLLTTWGMGTDIILNSRRVKTNLSNDGKSKILFSAPLRIKSSQQTQSKAALDSDLASALSLDWSQVRVDWQR